MACFGGSVLGTIVADPLLDRVSLYMAKLNNGVAEPEFRLVSMLFYCAFSATGFFVWGYTIGAGEPWPIPVIIGLGLIYLGLQLGTSGLIAYVQGKAYYPVPILTTLDCYRDKTAEAFAPINFAKCAFATGLTFFVNDWIAVQGVQESFYIVGGITIGVCLPTIPSMLSRCM
jgi:hypothetical protein